MKTFQCLLMIVALAFTSASIAANKNSKVSVQHTKIENAQQSLWGLSDKEWSRYQTLMKGPRGVWSPNLDPVSVLGIHADSITERKRYAEWLAKIEHARLIKEIAFQKEYDQAFKRLFPKAKVIGSAWDSLRFYTTTEKNSKRWIKALVDASINTKIDIFFTDSSDEEIRSWALRNGVPKDKVTERKITLNHHASSGRIASQTLLAIKDGNPTTITFDQLKSLGATSK